MYKTNDGNNVQYFQEVGLCGIGDKYTMSYYNGKSFRQ